MSEAIIVPVQPSICGGGGDLLYLHGPQAEQRVYGRQISSTVAGGYPPRILQDANRAPPVKTSWDLTTSGVRKCTGGVLSSQVKIPGVH
jgi:hypothetical protein